MQIFTYGTYVWLSTLQPFAWEAREFLRKKLIGKEVLFSVEYKVPGTGREYGCIYLQKGKLKDIHVHVGRFAFVNERND